jgi:OOP family OmpA-OmpF porin
VNKIKNIAITAALLGSSAAMAQSTDINPSWYIQPSINTFKPDSGFVVDQSAYGGGLKVGKPVAEHFDLQMGYTYSRAKEDNQRYQQETLGLDGLYLFSRKSFRPFVLLGAGAERDKLNLINRNEIRKSSPYISAGVGFQSDLSDRWSMQLDLRDVHGFLRGDAFPISKSNNYYLTLGVNYALGAKPVPPPPPAPVVVEPPPPPPAPVAPPPPPPPRFEKITMSSTELFGFDSAKLNPTQPKLDELATLLNDNPSVGNVVISGYTDRLGSDKYNQKLSQERANSVKAYLTGKGVSADRLSAVGKGESNPIVACEDKKMKRPALIKCLEPNRRVEVEQVTIERRVN